MRATTDVARWLAAGHTKIWTANDWTDWDVLHDFLVDHPDASRDTAWLQPTLAWCCQHRVAPERFRSGAFNRFFFDWNPPGYDDGFFHHPLYRRVRASVLPEPWYAAVYNSPCIRRSSALAARFGTARLALKALRDHCLKPQLPWPQDFAFPSRLPKEDPNPC